MSVPRPVTAKDNTKVFRETLLKAGLIPLKDQHADYSFFIYNVKIDHYKIPYTLFKENRTLIFINKKAFDLAINLLYSKDVIKNKLPNIWKAMHICAYSKCSSKNKIYFEDLKQIIEISSIKGVNEYLNKIQLTCCKYLKCDMR